MTYAGFCEFTFLLCDLLVFRCAEWIVCKVVHLASIPPVLRWLQYFSTLKYCLEALSVNEIQSGLTIQDKLQGVPVDVSAVVIMKLVRLPFRL